MFLLEQLVNGLVLGGYYLLIALGLSLIFSVGGIVNLAHGAFYALGAYASVEIAKYLGFEWRDTHPSGAVSIEWFDRWCRERSPETRQQILEYNEDDCRATRVLLDGIRALTA